jgi:hypothetical protein
LAVNKTYRCDGFYPVAAANMMHAAQLFAVQIARRKYGPKGRCRSVQLVLDQPRFGSIFEAFVGVPKGVMWDGETHRFMVRSG